MKKLGNKKLLITLVIATLAALGSLSAYYYQRQGVHYVKSYEDAAGWVYKCSRPIAAKDQGARYMSGATSYTPVDPAEAQQYCIKLGIE